MLPAIKAENIGKAYQLGEFSTGTISRDIERWWIRLRKKQDPFLKIGDTNDRSIKGNSDVVWSLRDINFEINQGDAVGIIGRNGAGKSTLLKILSRVTSPTTGSIKLNGRIASLLEVGTGFHPELTGRENIFLNGAILGMRKFEIRRKFDEIVDFSGVERYIDTPVKRYSSGMYVRLAFAVAAHLESEILVVDEVLAVGDAEFQKKCLGKMDDVSKTGGRTILFVSHSMGAVSQLCTKAILLDKGSLIKYDNTQPVIDYYISSISKNHHGYTSRKKDKEMTIVQAYTQFPSGEKTASATHLQAIQVVTKIHVNNWVADAELRLVLRDMNGKAIFTSDLPLRKQPGTDSENLSVIAEIPPNFLRPGNYNFTFATFVPHRLIIDLLEDVITLTVIDGGSKYASSEGMDYGYIFFEPQWSIAYNNKDEAITTAND